MASRQNILKKKVPMPTKPKQAKGKTPPSQELEKPFGAVGRMSAAPISIGTTIRSVPAVEKHGRDTVLITGRDFVGALMGVSTTWNNWVLSGGFPVSPAALTASALKGYFLTYQVFKVRRLVAHFISSSPTSTSGDIMILHHDNRGGPYVDHTSNNFMSYALSTPSAVLGPQWLNKSVEVVGSDTYGWIPTDLFNAEDVAHQAAGEILVYSKNTTNGSNADQPGYLLIDYQIEFSKKMVNPRSVTLPTSLGKIWMSSFIVTGAPVTGNSILSFSFGGLAYDGTTGVAPPGVQSGNIFKIGFDVSRSSTWTNVSVNTLAVAVPDRSGPGVEGNLQQIVFKTGMTLYGMYDSSSGQVIMYANYDAALSGNSLMWGTSNTVTLEMPIWMSLVGSITSGFAQSSI